MIVFDHGPAGNPRDLGYGGSGEPALPLYGVSFHMAHLYDEDPDLVHDRVIVDVWGDWVEPATPERDAVQPIDLKEHEQSYYEKRVIAVQNLLVQKGIMNIDESRRLAAEFDFQKHGSPHPMVSPP